MNAKVLLLLALVAAAAAEGSHSHEDSYGASSEEAKYEFNYQVKDDEGNDFGHEEKRDGDYTQGSYYNELPDGRRQVVTYEVDGNSGFVADVKYSGEAHYDSGSYESRSRESRSREYYN
ncbi:pro-resilin-like [Portunus trituberculatus]|uniref:pro-resilin-like n=1 Tax=Portunus trituberculatus TaxID=210409 RepID=UPI001E1CB944|nr:pro-resilin-like [Portunus trituberculatus]